MPQGLRWLSPCHTAILLWSIDPPNARFSARFLYLIHILYIPVVIPHAFLLFNYNSPAWSCPSCGHGIMAHSAQVLVRNDGAFRPNLHVLHVSKPFMSLQRPKMLRSDLCIGWEWEEGWEHEVCGLACEKAVVH